MEMYEEYFSIYFSNFKVKDCGLKIEDFLFEVYIFFCLIGLVLKENCILK